MIIVDTNCWIAYFSGERGRDIELLQAALPATLRMSPFVLAELFSDPLLPPELQQHLLDFPLAPPKPALWVRAGTLRASLLLRRYRPKLIDTLIAQQCIDEGATLLTRDRDFSVFAKFAGLQLL